MKTEALNPFGIEVTMDLNINLSPDMRASLLSLYQRHHLILFRNQNITSERHVQIAEIFGPVLRNAPDSISHVANDAKNGRLGSIRLAFHSDLGFSEMPYPGLSLYAQNVPAGASSTRFASGARAWRCLEPKTRDALENIQALSVFAADVTRRNRAAELDPALPRVVRPLVLSNPVTSEKFLYASYQNIDSLQGLDDATSEALLETVFAALFAPSNVLEHRWSNGDVLFWNNLVLQHARDDVSQTGPRVLHRIVLAERGFFDLYPQFNAETYDPSFDELVFAAAADGNGKPRARACPEPNSA